MKKKILAMALSCATLAVLVMPSASAVEYGYSSGEITDSSGITLTGSATYTLPSVASIDLDGAGVDSRDKCWYNSAYPSSTARQLNNYFTVTDTDASATHYIKVGEYDADGGNDGNFKKGTSGGTAVDIAVNKLFMSLERSTAADCSTANTDVKTTVATKVAGGSLMTSVALASSVWTTGAPQTFLAMSDSNQTFLTGTNGATIQYRFAPRTWRIFYPQYGTANTYATTLVFGYYAS